MGSSNVELYDPLEIITEGSRLYNRIPKSEDMFIYAELNAVRRGNSTLVSTNGLLTQELNSMNSDMSVNLLGFNENGYYTTKYTSNVGNSSTPQYEGFGISKIDVKMNSSYVPMVTIEFIDIRGMCYFNRNNISPYQILEDFPPPIFQLTLKGYYGKPLKYQLHKVRSNSKFDSNSGNYIITAEFVANTFAPITDILFKYTEIIPLIDDWKNGINFDNNFKTEPKHVYQLLYKLGNLYDNVSDVVKNSKESDSFNNAKDKYKSIQDIFLTIVGFQNSMGDFINDSNKAIFNVSDNNDLSTMRFIKNISEYDDIVKGFGSSIPDSPNQQFLLTIKTKDGNVDTAFKTLVSFGDSLINEINKQNIYSAISSDYTKRAILYPNSSGSTYACIDISKIYIKLYKELNISRENVKKYGDELNSTLNNIAITELGFKPTIGRIFKILCDDIDATFDKLRDVARKAEEHHEKYKTKILNGGGYADTVQKIRAFPRFVKEQMDSGPCATRRQVLAYPEFKNLKNADEKFPELEFVDEFITAFIRNKKAQETQNLKDQKDENGNSKWMPISPLDSTLIPGGNDESPYVDLTADGIFKTFLDRYYVYTQHIMPLNFYSKYKFDELFAKSEALNIANSISDESKLIPQLINYSNVGTSNPYNVLSGFSNYNTIDVNTITINGVNYPHPKSNELFSGIYVLESSEINEKNTSDVTDPTNEFLEENCNGFWNIISKALSGDKISDVKFTTDNLPYFKDLEQDNNYDSKYYKRSVNYTNTYAFIDQDFVGSVIHGLGFDTAGISLGTVDNRVQDAINILSDGNIPNVIKIALITSVFGNIKTPQNSSFFKKYYSVSSIIELPKIIPVFFGATLSCDLTTLDSIKEMFIQYDNGGKTEYWWDFIYDNITYLNTNLSVADKNTLKSYYEKFNTENNVLLSQYIQMLSLSLGDDDKNIADLLTRGGTYENISEILNKRVFLALMSDLSFSTQSGSTYQSLPTILSDTTKNKKNTNLFILFFNKLKSQLENRQKELTEITKNTTQSINDNDIKTQLYYSFKNIVDKWILDVDTKSPIYMGSANPLIDRFAFVDRAMNDISGLDPDTDGCIINVDGLIEVAKDYDTNVFSMFSRILSDNNFEFFPLQNFLSFANGEWKNAFKIHTTINNDSLSGPTFMCMYVGGNSSILDTGNQSFVDDGILDLENDSDLLDFQSSGCKDSKTSTNSNFKFSNVKAFRVKFGQQNQSIFKGIELDTTEFSETNESLAILSKIANDESSASPVPKGQNLFSTYENRSYTCKVNMLGNVMIQPTQYFQLENVPMYNGAYLITNVEHSVIPNQMSTTFTGTRIAKYPKPIVTEFAKSVLSNGTSIDDSSSVDGNSNNKTYTNISSENLPDEAKYNSMFTLKI